MGDSRYKEYLLPHQFGEGLGHSKDANPCFARFSGLRSDEVAELLREDWAKIQGPAVVMFRDSLRPFQPISLIHCADERDFRSDSGWWLRMNGPPTHNEWDTQVFLTAPPDRGALNESRCVSIEPDPEWGLACLSGRALASLATWRRIRWGAIISLAGAVKATRKTVGSHKSASRHRDRRAGKPSTGRLRRLASVP